MLFGLRSRKEIGEMQHLPAELVQSRVRQFHLRLDPADTSDPETRPLGGGIVKQSGLADARLAAEDQRSAGAS